MPQATLERTVLRATPYLVIGLVAALPLLAVPVSVAPLAPVTVHLSALVVFALLLALRLATDGDWFHDLTTPRARALATAAAHAVLVTGTTALVGLATAAALRLQPSLQFLQLLSILDIAWAGAAIVWSARRLWGESAAVAGGLALGAVCTWSIWRYLDTVGFTNDGGWVVDGGELAKLVLPYDMAAAAVALGLVALAVRPDGQPTEQPRAQS